MDRRKFFLTACTLLLMLLSFAQNENIPTPQWRPVYHFTPEKNWTNDPNGPIYLDGEFHLYNQQNPFENKWGHMSWGHAKSRDLLHWEHLPVAIPERVDKEDTTWIFSGSAVWDKNNTSGFCKNGGCIVAIYTADQPNLKKESQFIAFSNDGGMTFTNYENNPVIDLHKKDFRDPNVFWYEASKQWIMVVALPAEHAVRFYGSPDLKNWSLLSEFGNQGYTGAAWECPFLIQLDVNGVPGLKKWVLVNSAAGSGRGVYMQYFVGDFDGKTFRNDNPPDKELAVDYGDCFYAAIPWNNMPGNEKLFIGWLVPGRQETYPWRGQMSIPRDLSLENTDQGIRLLQQPASMIKDELEKLPGDHVVNMKDLKINGLKSLMGKAMAGGNAYWLDAEWNIKRGTKAGFIIGRQKNKDSRAAAAAIVGYDAATHEIFVERSSAGPGKINKEKLRQTISMRSKTGKIRLQILVDRSSLEVFINNGEQVLSTYIFPNKDADGLSAFATGGEAVIGSLKIWDLSE